mgnify:CR=1 FL=1
MPPTSHVPLPVLVKSEPLKLNAGDDDVMMPRLSTVPETATLTPETLLHVPENGA